MKERKVFGKGGRDGMRMKGSHRLGRRPKRRQEYNLTAWVAAWRYKDQGSPPPRGADKRGGGTGLAIDAATYGGGAGGVEELQIQCAVPGSCAVTGFL